MFDHSQSTLLDKFELVHNSENYLVKKYHDKYGHEYFRFQDTKSNDFILMPKGKLPEWTNIYGNASELSKALGALVEKHYSQS
jgi:hypothetical protein